MLRRTRQLPSTAGIALRLAWLLLLCLPCFVVTTVSSFQQPLVHRMISRVIARSRPWALGRRTCTRQYPSARACCWKTSFHPGQGKSWRLFSAVPEVSPVFVEEDHDEHEPHSAAISPGHGEDDSMDKYAQDLLVGLRSRPRPGGNWDPAHPLAWTENFGRRSPEYEKELQSKIRLSPGDEGYFDVSEIEIPREVTVVRTVEDARKVMERLMNDDPKVMRGVVHACDTEVMDIDLNEVGPVGNGYVTCASIYSGPTFDYGLGDGPGTSLWIDNLDDACGVLQEFKPFFEARGIPKIWHNYGFDRHVMWNEGIDCQGLAGDTMHMARLENTSRGRGGGTGYSLEALTHIFVGKRKRPMKEIFGVPRLRKDGTPGAIVDVPPIDVLQRDPRFRANFIDYSCFDAKGTWKLYMKLASKLKDSPWRSEPGSNLLDYYNQHMREFGHVLTDMERRGIRVDAKDYLASVERQARQDRDEHSLKFRSWAAKKIGPDGLALNIASSLQLSTFLFGGAENPKTKQKSDDVKVFTVPRDEVPEDALEAFRLRDEENDKKLMEQGKGPSEVDYLQDMKAAQLKELCREHGLKLSGKKSELQDRLKEFFLTGSGSTGASDGDGFDSMSEGDLVDALRTRGLPDTGSRAEMLSRLREDIDFACELSAVAERSAFKNVAEAMESFAAMANGATREILDEIKAKAQEVPKNIDVTIRSLGMTPPKYTAGGAPSVTADVLRTLAGDPFADPPRYGTAYEFFDNGEEGHEACVALFSLCSIGSIDTMIANFLTSLQTLSDHDSRVHCSLNLNTETGRLSSRRPNLQNQPALEKDTYKIRKAFRSSPGNKLIVADYGQLELRLLASMTGCESMIKAFEAGGDFHSRTAMDMFDYVRAKVDSGDVLLEWDYSKGDPPKPLLKDEYASERRKAKTLNFSIAYGKTAHGLSKDWGVSIEEAQDMLGKWYAARPEVEGWQNITKAYARRFGKTKTMMGRHRDLPEAQSSHQGLVSAAERASINTPIQGGAADVAMMAMNKINKSEKLRRLGWILLMQIHDEVILEGPEETAEEAFEEVVLCMQEPWVEGLAPTKVPLLVDGSYTHETWYDAK